MNQIITYGKNLIVLTLYTWMVEIVKHNIAYLWTEDYY